MLLQGMLLLGFRFGDLELELARRVFSEMPIKDDVSWSTMIVGLKWLMKVTQGNLNSCVVIP